MNEQTIHCNQACTITVQHEFATPVLSLTVEQGFQISLAIIGCWAVGWAIRALITTLRDSAKHEESSS